MALIWFHTLAYQIESCCTEKGLGKASVWERESYQNRNGKVLCPITSAHESNLDNNYSNLHCEKQVSNDDEWRTAATITKLITLHVQTISLEKY